MKGFRAKIENVFNSRQFSNDNIHFAGRGALRKGTQIGGKWIDKDRNDFLPIAKVKVIQIGGPNESIMTELIFTN